MKATIVLLMFASRLVCGQAQPHSQPESKRQSRQWLRVGLKLDSQLTTTTEKQIRDLFTRQLRQLGDVEAVPLLTDHYPLDSNEVHDVKLRVLVSGSGIQELLEQLNSALRRPSAKAPARQYAIAAIATRPMDREKQTLAPDRVTIEAWQKGFISMNDLQKQIFAAAWLAVADERHLEITCADIINKFDHEVLEADRKKIRFPETLPAPTVTAPPASAPQH